MATIDPWPHDEAARLAQTARFLLRDHGPHGDKLSRDNCGACALVTPRRDPEDPHNDAPNYAGWLRVYIEARRPIPATWFAAEIAYAERENRGYYDAIVRDLVTFGATIQKG